MNNFNECGFGGGNDCLWIILLMLCGGGCKASGAGGASNITPILVAPSCCGCGGCNDCGCK